MLHAILSCVIVLVIAACGAVVLSRLKHIFKLRRLDKSFVEQAEDIAHAARIAGATAAFAAWVLTPTGILAFFVAKPAVLFIAPFAVAFGLAASAFASAAKLYVKQVEARRAAPQFKESVTEFNESNDF